MLRISVSSSETIFRPRAQAFMQLPAPDIDCIDTLGAALQQHLREAAGGGADIEADAALRIEAEMIERRGELHAAARHIRMRRRRAQFRIDRDFFRGLAHRRRVGGDQPGRDRGLRLGAALEQAALDQQAIDAIFFR